MISGLAVVLSWLGAVSVDAGIVLSIIGGLTQLLFLIILGLWLLMQPEREGAAAA